jgi:hypothetical protein
MSMNWYGAVKGESGFVAIVETPFDAALDVTLNNTTDSSPSSTARPPPSMGAGSFIRRA